MPTYGDETLHERYAREHADHLARLAKMTPEQIAEMELSLHNAMAELDRLRAQASQGGEAVEVVATVEAYGGKWAGIHWGECIGSTEDPERQLMTVAQHQRILAAATHPADQVAEPDAELVALLRDERNYRLVKASCQLGITARCLCVLCRDFRIDAKLASLKP